MASFLLILKTSISRRWLPATILILSVMLIFGRLGLWQLDRLEQRRTLNATIIERPTLPALSLNDLAPETPINDDITNYYYRQALATGHFDFERQLLLTLKKWRGPDNAAFINDVGAYLVTPLRLDNHHQAILIVRGWIPEAATAPHNLSTFQDIPQSKIQGIILRSQTLPAFGQGKVNTLDAPRLVWTHLNISAIQNQLPYPLLPFYILQTAPKSNTLPYRITPEYDLSEGSHLSYSLQWFSFALILGAVYGSYIYRAVS